MLFLLWLCSLYPELPKSSKQVCHLILSGKLDIFRILVYHNVFVFSPQAVVEKSHMQSELFNLYLHQNYLDFFSDIDDVVRASEYLSAADVLTGDWNVRCFTCAL